jgi:fructose-1,6-bisphosphatase/inositol monophosphatase family enzyme
VIKGWTEAMQMMVEGDKWEMYIPSDLAYGDRGRPPLIPPSSVLIFTMEIIRIKGNKVERSAYSLLSREQQKAQRQKAQRDTLGRPHATKTDAGTLSKAQIDAIAAIDATTAAAAAAGGAKAKGSGGRGGGATIKSILRKIQKKRRGGGKKNNANNAAKEAAAASAASAVKAARSEGGAGRSARSFVRLSDLLSSSLELAGSAGREIKRLKGGDALTGRDGAVQQKGFTDEGVADVVTEADLKSNDIIVGGLRARYPKTCVLTEEGSKEVDKGKEEGAAPSHHALSDLSLGDLRTMGASGGMTGRAARLAATLGSDLDRRVSLDDIVIVVDPLDATKEYAEGGTLTHYVSTMICIVEAGVPIAAVVHFPFGTGGGELIDSDGGGDGGGGGGGGGKTKPESVWGVVGRDGHPGVVRSSVEGTVEGGVEGGDSLHTGTVSELPPHKHSGTVIMSRSHMPGQSGGHGGLRTQKSEAGVSGENAEGGSSSKKKKRKKMRKKGKKKKKKNGKKKHPPLHFDVAQVFGRRHTALHAAGAGFKAVQVLNGRAEAYVHATKIKVWDMCPVHVLMAAKGGRLEDSRGKALRFPRRRAAAVSPTLPSTLPSTLRGGERGERGGEKGGSGAGCSDFTGNKGEAELQVLTHGIVATTGTKREHDRYSKMTVLCGTLR